VPPAADRAKKVLIAARSGVRQAGLEKMLAESSDFRAVGVCAGIAAVKERARQLTPDIVLLDWDGQSDAAAFIGPLEHITANINAVVLLDDPAPELVAALLALGVRAVLERDVSVDELTSALQSAVDGLTVLGAEIARTLGERLPHSHATERRVPVEELTDRELEVLELLAEGIGNREIAARLGISEHTVKFHISSILSKLRASSRTEAVTYGIRQGLIVV
jgi:DNA-binding NarL/FixJ family response regulator